MRSSCSSAARYGKNLRQPPAVRHRILPAVRPAARQLTAGRGILGGGHRARIMTATTGDRAAALASRARDFVRDDSVVGLGAGRAASAFVRALAARARGGLRVRGVPASEDTARLARELGIALVGLEAELDLTVDGADEVDRGLNLIKGYGGAFVRERIVAAASRRQGILVTADKLVETLGGRGPLSVEVLPFAPPPLPPRLGGLRLKPPPRPPRERPFVA